MPVPFSVFRALLLALSCCAILSPAQADRRPTAAICQNAALTVSRETGVPVDVLRAISLTETGRKNADGFLPWPWTVNMEGKGKWFDSAAAARAYVDKHFARGARSFDVGCFQINYRWHGQHFDSIEAMFDPLTNTRYAASFLSDLYEEFGDWSKAAGAYHSRTPKFARKYAKRFNSIRARLGDLDPSMHAPAQPPVQQASAPPPTAPDPVAIIARINRFPLLQSGAPGTPGSLVPHDTAASGSLFGAARAQPMMEMR
ncbi:MAG: lytic transglycosylase domain-containing protein [Silicimonas sp.]|nr:lytic transglycosylase domain-containing protein [Silicimonas sp.]